MTVLIPGKLYICVVEHRKPLLYTILDNTTNIVEADQILGCNVPVCFTGKFIKGNRDSSPVHIFAYYEFLHMTKIVYIMGIEYLTRL